MLVGTFIVGTWRVLVRGQPFFRRRHHCRRRGTSHSHHRKSSRTETASVEEKSGLMEEQEVEVEAPPAYDEEQAPKDAA